MKSISIALLLISSAVAAETFSTDHYSFHIERGCEEGEVSCASMKVRFSPAGMDKQQTVMAKTVHTRCADGVTPCAFQGYEFHADGSRYFLHVSGMLEVTDAEGRQLLLESGEWRY